MESIWSIPLKIRWIREFEWLSVLQKKWQICGLEEIDWWGDKGFLAGRAALLYTKNESESSVNKVPAKHTNVCWRRVLTMRRSVQLLSTMGHSLHILPLWMIQWDTKAESVWLFSDNLWSPAALLKPILLRKTTWLYAMILYSRTMMVRMREPHPVKRTFIEPLGSPLVRLRYFPFLGPKLVNRILSLWERAHLLVLWCIVIGRTWSCGPSCGTRNPRLLRLTLPRTLIIVT